jgi:hypothetical protein
MKSVRIAPGPVPLRSGARRILIGVTATTAALVVAVPMTAGAVAGPNQTNVVAAAKVKVKSSFKVRPVDFGIHSYSADPNIPAGTIRIAGSPTWRQVQPEKGTWDWSLMETTLDRAKDWGFSEVLISIYGTPEWAGSKVSDPGSEILGRNSTSAPVRMSDWKTYISNLVQKYKDRISGYQIWNESTSPQFYQGSSKKLAKMTKQANKIINKYDPSAVVVASSVQTHRQSWYDGFVPSFFNELKKKKWPVDALAGHFYPAGNGGPNKRVKQIDMFNLTADLAGAPTKLQRWDTETNFSLGSHASTGVNPEGRIRGSKAAQYVARTYLDSWRLGISRTFWYLWTDSYNDFPGIQMYNASQPGPAAYRKVSEWTVGQKFSGCNTKKNLVNCKFKKSGKISYVLFTTKGEKTYKFSGTKQACKVDSNSCSSAKKSVRVSKMPVRLS